LVNLEGKLAPDLLDGQHTVKVTYTCPCGKTASLSIVDTINARQVDNKENKMHMILNVPNREPFELHVDQTLALLNWKELHQGAVSSQNKL